MDDARLVVDTVGQNVNLRPGVGSGGAPARLQRHGEQRDGDLLAGCEQHVQFPWIGDLLRALREAEEAVGFATHRRYDHDDVVAPVARVLDPGSDMRDPLDTSNRSASEFLNDQRHDDRFLIPGPGQFECLANRRVDNPSPSSRNTLRSLRHERTAPPSSCSRTQPWTERIA